MHSPLGGDSCGQDEGGQNSHVNLTDPRNNNLQKSTSNLKHSNESMSSHGLSSLSGTIGERDWAGEIDDSDAALKYINHVLLEEELDSEASMSQDASALQAFEKSFYDGLGQNPPPYQYKPMVDSDLGLLDPISGSWCGIVDGPGNSSASVLPVTGLVSRFDSDNEVWRPPGPNEDARHYSSNSSRGRKDHEREDIDYVEEETSRRNSTNYIVETELSDMFDKVLLCDEASLEDEISKKMQERGQPRGQEDNHNKERVDLTTLLTQCAQAVASYDQMTAWERLMRIRQHSSPFGDTSQRLLHCFANGLEARLVGTGGQISAGRLSRIVSGTPASDILKAYHEYISFCPFMRASCCFINRTLQNLMKDETSVHIIDFGILHGFQWPVFLQLISTRPGGPPKLRITGIELPQAGLHPSEGVVETGHCLSYYCRRFNIPFEYCPIAKAFETIQPEDLTIHDGEFLVVSSLFRFGELLDATVVPSCPRDAVLDLIRSINPNVFIHGVVNGTYNSPFFLTRFQEALFHFSSLFGMLEACLPRESETRMLFETEIYGNVAMNVIASEGAERFERPETFKQWHNRHRRAGFRRIPLNRDVLNEIKGKVMLLDYHTNFMVEENSQWMLLGWKGRITHALSCWKPA